MIEKVIHTIKQNNMFNCNDKVVVGVSGGPDSICLLHILNKLKKSLGIELFVAHINHCLRGEEADKDEKYVREFCEELNIQCFVKKADVHRISKENGVSCEMAGREVRYEFFSEVMDKVGANKVAVAHNANDQAETVLMRMLRGTGLEGLIGIRAVRDNIFVRPIINITRDEIENYCQNNKLSARIDKSNLENIYTRNKIRLELIPYIRENFNPDVIEALNRFSSTVKVDNEYLNKVSSKKYNEFCSEKENRVILKADIFKEDEAILTRVIRKALKNIKGDLCNFDKKHIYDIIHLQNKSTGKVLMLPDNIIALNNYGDIHVYVKLNRDSMGKRKKEYILQINKTNKLEDTGLTVTLELLKNNEDINFDKSPLIKYFNYDKINGEIKLRYRKDGDKFTPIGMKGTKKVKDLFMDLKVPKEQRDLVPLLLFDEDISWIVGYRISNKFKINSDTKTILKIKIERGE